MIYILMNDTDFADELSPLEVALDKLGIRYRAYRTFREGFPCDLSDCTGIIVSGGLSMSGYFDGLARLEGARLLMRFDRPILGICLGMQILARLEGVSLVTSRELGVSRVYLDSGCVLFKGMPTEIDVYQRHNYGLPYVPSGYSLIAGGDSTFVQGISRLDRSIFGIQFHPEELESGSSVENIEILRNFSRILE
jgi:GMP synthase (glutamine-hydrolysing)